jgi:hypothetical protein
LPEAESAGVLTMVGALIAGADPELWARYCCLAAELEGRSAGAPTPAPGSVEWQMQQDRPVKPAEQASPQSAIDAGRRRLSRRGAPLPFAGAPSPFGATGSDTFDAFLTQHRGSPPLLAQLDTLEDQLVEDFKAAGRSGRYRLGGFWGGARSEVMPTWFGQARLDFARNVVLLPDGSEIAGIEVTIGSSPTDAPPAAAAGRDRERPAQTMLRQALIALWERGAFSAGTGNERVLALALHELGLSPSDPPYGFKSAETVRKLRKALKMSL